MSMWSRWYFIFVYSLTSITFFPSTAHRFIICPYRSLIMFSAGAVLALLMALHGVDGVYAAHVVASTHSNSTSHMRDDWTCPMYGIDNYGDNLDVIENVGSWEDCGFLCLQRPDCVAWGWNHERAGRRCYLKANEYV